MEASSFARDGFCIVRRAIDSETVAALVADAESRTASSDCTICEPPAALDDPARLSNDAYLRLRAQSTNIGSKQAALIARALFETLPACAAYATNWSAADDDWRLMHEAYLIKPAHGGAHYLWHRDGDRHLWCAEGVEDTCLDSPPGLVAHVAAEALAPDEAGQGVEAELYARPPLRAAVPYLTVWTALSRTTRQNGTLVILPAQATAHRDAGVWAARPCGAACEAAHGVALELEPGDLCVFGSDVFHTSRPNASDEPRRARRVPAALQQPSDLWW